MGCIINMIRNSNLTSNQIQEIILLYCIHGIPDETASQSENNDTKLQSYITIITTRTTPGYIISMECKI